MRKKEIADKYGTPVYIYSREIIEKRIAELQKFDIVRFAQKACNGGQSRQFQAPLRSNIGILCCLLMSFRSC